MERTHRWAERSLAAHTRPDQALFGIIQGGVDPELRERSTRFIAGMPFDGICIGGLAGDETPVERAAALDVVIPILEGDPRPRYLMGLGSPADLLDAVRLGVDLFDSVLPARVARNGQLWVPGGKLNLRNTSFQDDPRPVQEDCPCRLCRSFSRAYLAHLFRAKELLAFRLATCHNLTFTLDFMSRIRAALRTGTFPELLASLRVHAGRQTAGAAVDGAGVKSLRVPFMKRGGPLDGLSRSTKPRGQEEAEGQVGRAEVAAALRTADECRAVPEGAQATHNRRGPRRNLIHRVDSSSAPMVVATDRSVTGTWR